MRKILLNAVLFIVVAAVVPGISLNGGIGSAIIASLIYSVLASTLKPLLEFVATPFNFLTFGLVNFLIGVSMLSVTAAFSALDIHSAGSAILAGIAFGFLQSLFEYNRQEGR